MLVLSPSVVVSTAYPIIARKTIPRRKKVAR
jgi:hypothetical protein